MNKLKKALVGLGIFIVLASYYNVDHNYNRTYEIIEDDDCKAYAMYCDGYIYIGDRDFLESIDCSSGDILVEDKRYFKKDPDMVVYKSCNITDKDIRNDVIEVLQIYENDHPSDWDRTTKSMRLEWYMHNLSYDFQFRKDRTEDVDLDNDDEEKYDNKVLSKILKL